MKDKVTCQICFKELKQINNSHLSSHGIDISLYKEMFPNEHLTSELTRHKISKTKKSDFASGKVKHHMLGKSHSEETKRKISNSNIGTEVSFETKQKLKVAVQKRKDNGSFVPNMLGKSHSEETKLRISEKSKASLKEKREQRFESYKNLCFENNIFLKNQIDNHHFELECLVCNTIFNRSINVFYKSKNYFKELCPVCYPIAGVSKLEIEVHEFIKSVYKNEIVFNDTSILGGKEIDILLPLLKIGFEFNGLYWHSVKVNDNKNHLLHKTQFCWNKGIKLYHIFEDEWIHKKEIVKARIKHILGIYDRKIHGRKCKISRIDSIMKNDFLNKYHLQQSDMSSIRYGAFYEDELLGVMTFTKTSFVKGGNGSSYELNRFATIHGTHVPGLAGKLFSAFIKEYDPLEVITYADRRWSHGNVYSKIGFNYLSSSVPSYWYFKNSKNFIRLHRSNFMKHTLKNKLVNFDESLTEIENMLNNDYNLIYDCGTTKWIYKRP